MADLELELSTTLIDQLRRLAQLHYGDDGDEAVSRVIAAALEMRLLWMELVPEGLDAVEEPLLNWKIAGSSDGDLAQEELRDWLFRRRD